LVKADLQVDSLNPDSVPTCRDSEAQKTLARREVGAILCRKHIYKYVEEQNRERSVAVRIFKSQ